VTDHPVRIVVTDDLARRRGLVALRLFLVIPHLLWAALIGTAVSIAVFFGWWIALFKGKLPDGLREFVAGYTRYATQVEAYFLLVADPYPGFYLFDDKPYPVDVTFGPNERQNRWTIGFRIFLAIPALIVASALLWGGVRGGGYGYGGGVGLTAAVLAWFYILATGRAPRGIRDLGVYCLAYSTQLWAYLFLLTDRYPYSGPNAYAPADAAREHPVTAYVTDDLRRSRMLTLFRLPIAAPHIVWLVLWSILAWIVAFLNWLCTLATGRPPRPFHRFLSAYIRYSTHFLAFFCLIGNPFPGFVGAPGSYPVDVALGEPQRQHRAATGFRLLLAIPAFALSGGTGGALWAAAFLGWFASLVCGRMPDGLRNMGAWSLRYSAQVSAYAFVLTDRYPDCGPRPDPASP